MDHTQARKMKAVERYILGDLPPADAEEFEQHFFGCVECSEDLHLAASLAENARSVVAAGQPVVVPARKSRWSDFLLTLWRPPVAAAFAVAALSLAVLAGYQNSVTIPGLRRQASLVERIQAPVSYSLRAAARGDESDLSVPASSPFFIVRFDPAWEQPASSLRCSLRSPSGASVLSVTAAAPGPGKPVSLVCPTRLVGAGKWLLTVDDSDSGIELARYSFTIHYR